MNCDAGIVNNAGFVYEFTFYTAGHVPVFLRPTLLCWNDWSSYRVASIAAPSHTAASPHATTAPVVQSAATSQSRKPYEGQWWITGLGLVSSSPNHRLVRFVRSHSPLVRSRLGSAR
jgi:hypothetical protein